MFKKFAARINDFWAKAKGMCFLPSKKQIICKVFREGPQT